MWDAAAAGQEDSPTSSDGSESDTCSDSSSDSSSSTDEQAEEGGGGGGWPLKGGLNSMNRMISLPESWPLARLMLPLQPIVRPLEHLLQGYCYETIATNADSTQHTPYVQ